MAASNRDARRRKRILEGGQDRLALITGRKQHFSADISNDPDLSFDSQSTPPAVSHHLSLHQPDLRHDLIFDPPPPVPPPQPQPQSQPISDFQNEGEKSSDTANSTRDEAPKYSQSDPLSSDSSVEPIMRKPEQVTEPSRAPTNEHKRGESSTPARKALVIAAELAQRIPLSHLSLQQVGIAVAETENYRMLCAIVMSILVVLSSARFPIFNNFLFRWIILLRPLIFLIFANLGLIARRLILVNQKKLGRGAKDENKPVLGGGYAWAEEAGRALELGLILQSVGSALFMDCSVYAAIIVFGLSLLS